MAFLKIHFRERTPAANEQNFLRSLSRRQMHSVRNHCSLLQ